MAIVFSLHLPSAASARCYASHLTCIHLILSASLWSTVFHQHFIVWGQSYMLLSTKARIHTQIFWLLSFQRLLSLRNTKSKEVYEGEERLEEGRRTVDMILELKDMISSWLNMKWGLYSRLGEKIKQKDKRWGRGQSVLCLGKGNWFRMAETYWLC